MGGALVLGPDVRAIGLGFWMALSIPIMMGMLAIVLVSCTGAEGDARRKLSPGAYLLVATLGTIVGWACLGGVIGIGLFIVESCYGLILVLGVAALLGSLTAYWAAKTISSDMKRS